MTTDAQPKDPFLRDLQSVLSRDLPPTELAQNYSRLRLQPIAVPPPPAAGPSSLGQVTGAQVSAEDDLPADEAMQTNSRRRLPLVMAIAIILIGASAITFLMLNLSGDPRDSSSVSATPPVIQAIPEIKVDPNAEVRAKPPSEPVQPLSMGQVSTDLIAPSTEGLTPARKIGTIRILVEGDKEIGTLR
ncbi:MAG: hypothetical protein ACKVON_09845 [Beijerinckiaceae bacterium]